MNHDKNQSERFSINVHGGNVQVIPDAQNSTITQNNFSVNLSTNDILSLIEDVKKTAPVNLAEYETEEVNSSLSIIETEVKSPAPKKSLLRNAIATLKIVKGTAEFTAAVATLVQFVQALLTK